MSSEVPYATPYPWDSPMVEESQKYANRGLRKRRFIGSGFASVRKHAFGSESSIGDVAKTLLINILLIWSDMSTEKMPREKESFQGI